MMTRKEFFEANRNGETFRLLGKNVEANLNATFEDYKKYLTIVILLIEHLGRLPTKEEIEDDIVFNLD